MHFETENEWNITHVRDAPHKCLRIEMTKIEAVEFF